MESNAVNNLPPRVRSVEETGLDVGAIADLAIKTLYSRGVMRVTEIADALKLPYTNIVDKALDVLRDGHLIETKAGTGVGDSAYRYAVTRSGRIRVQDLMERNQYLGPAPVSLDAYTKMVKAQSMTGKTVMPETLRRVLGHLVLGDEVLDKLGPAINGGRSIFIYGHAGNGKTSIGMALGRLLTDAIWIPYAIDVQGQIIKVFDPLRHQAILKETEEETPLPVRKGLLDRLARGKTDDGETPPPIIIRESYDERWVLIRRPLIVAGGELTLKNLDLVYDSTMKYYEAPQQMKANGGIFLLDDLGRQQASPREILNRWTVPLEKRVDYFNLAIGYKFQVPFDVLVMFATNLNPEELMDEAFLRRLRYKVHIADPTWDEFREIFRRESAKRAVTFSEQGMQYLIDEHFIKCNRQPRGVHGRDLMEQLVDIARFKRIPPAMTPALLDGACKAYFIQEP